MRKDNKRAVVLLMITPLVLIGYEVLRVIIGENVIPGSCSLLGILLLWMEAIRRKMCFWYQATVLFLGLVSMELLSGPVTIIFGGAFAIKLVRIWRENSKQ